MRHGRNIFRENKRKRENKIIKDKRSMHALSCSLQLKLLTQCYSGEKEVVSSSQLKLLTQCYLGKKEVVASSPIFFFFLSKAV